MTPPDEALLIAPPRRFGLYVWLYCLTCAVLLDGICAAGFAARRPGRSDRRVSPDRAGCRAVRAVRLAAFTGEDSLTFRNWLTTRRFDRRFIRGFRMRGSFMGPGRNAIQVTSADGSTVPITASISPW
jgi:hypothetical protein